jgi:hypothetical protein
MTLELQPDNAIGVLQFTCDGKQLVQALKRASVVPPESKAVDRAPILVLTVENDSRMIIWSSDDVRFIRVRIDVADISGPRRTFGYPVQYVAGLRFAEGRMQWAVRFSDNGVAVAYLLENGTRVEHSGCDARSDLRREQATTRSHGSVPAALLRVAITMAQPVMPASVDHYTDLRHRSLTLDRRHDGEDGGELFAGDGIRGLLISHAITPLNAVTIRDTHLPYILKFLGGIEGDVELSESDHHLFLGSGDALLGVARWTLPAPPPRRDRDDRDHLVLRVSRDNFLEVLRHARSEMAPGYVRMRLEVDVEAEQLQIRAKWSPGGIFIAAPLPIVILRAHRRTLATSLHLDHLIEALDAGVSGDVELRFMVPKIDQPELVLARIVEDISLDAAGLVWDPAAKAPKHRREPIERLCIARSLPCMNPA